MSDPMETSAGMQSFYQRLCRYADAHTADDVRQWLDENVLPEPHREREIAALTVYHAKHKQWRGTTTSRIISQALAVLSKVNA